MMLVDAGVVDWDVEYRLCMDLKWIKGWEHGLWDRDGIESLISKGIEGGALKVLTFYLPLS